MILAISALALATPVAAAPRAKASPQGKSPVAAKSQGPKGKAPKAVDPLTLSDKQLERRIKKDLPSLGSMSVGRANSGVQFNAVRMPKGRGWKLMAPGLAYGTRETIDYLSRAIDATHARHPGSHKLYIGHISAKRGGYLSPHKSHQSGRDVDISYFYRSNKKLKWYRRVNAANLDRARTWAFVRNLITKTDVEYIFINTSVQKLLKEHALKIGEDKDWLNRIFQYRGERKAIPIIRHARGHDTHIHVRFYNPKAQKLGRRAYAALVKHKLIKPRTQYIRHKARKGDILGNLAKRYKTTVRELKRINKIRGNKIFIGRTYRIPKKVKKGHVKRMARVVIPARRLPPGRAGTTGARKSAPAENE